MTDPRTPAQIAEALEALAVENDEVDAIVSGGEHRAPLLRAAAAKLREMELALKPFAELADVRLCGRWRDDESTQATDLSYRIKFGHLRAARSALGNAT